MAGHGHAARRLRQAMIPALPPKAATATTATMAGSGDPGARWCPEEAGAAATTIGAAGSWVLDPVVGVLLVPLAGTPVVVGVLPEVVVVTGVVAAVGALLPVLAPGLVVGLLS
ncbi:MAG: hypothetical protein ACLP2J_12185 [Acidimicrobiales bacterium]